MKFIWEPEDIKCGRYYYKGDSGNHSDIGYLASVTQKIGYVANSPSSGKRLVGISITDGMVGQEYTREEFAKMLNDNSYVPLHTSHLVQIIAHCAEQNEGR
jgi:hypothetical protein